MGMVFLFVLVSLLCSAVNEMLAQVFRMRSKNLEAGLGNLLQSGEGNKLVDDLYKHPLINGLSKEGQKPSYIPPKNFTLALMDIMTGNTGKLPSDNKALIETIEKQGLFAKTEAGKSIILLLHEAGDDAEKARKNLEGWYNDAMDRVGGWYKQKTQIVIFAVALIVCTALNIDAIKISETLWRDIALRQALVEMASSADITSLMAQQPAEQKPPTAGDDKSPELPDNPVEADTATTRADAIKGIEQSARTAGALIGQIRELHLPIGWKKPDGQWAFAGFGFMEWLIKILGILITTFAGSLGAPFWFQLLNKIVDLRAAGKQPGKSGGQ